MSAPAPVVLVVEDDPSVRGLIASVLLERGWEVVTASDGLEGLLKLEISRPSLMILDIMMPNVEGGRVLEEVSADPRLREVPVIVVSGVPDAHGAFDGVVGRDNVFVKPFDPDLLVARAAELLGEGESRGGNGA